MRTTKWWRVSATIPARASRSAASNAAQMEISERMLREVFLPPWVAGIRGAGALGVMATYPAIDGVPTHASEKILTKILREELTLRRTGPRRG